MTGLGSLFGGLARVALVFAVIVLVVLAILMPYYVYKIAQHARDLTEHAKALNEKADAARIEQGKTNSLLRQLLISYGQDPQA
jgi:uncharacterized membrane protein